MIKKVVLSVLIPMLLFNVGVVSADSEFLETIYVSATETVQVPDGSLNHPYTRIQDALDSIDLEADTRYVIEVDEGLYLEEVLIKDLSNVEINGSGKGKTIIAPYRPYVTNSAYNGISIDNSHHIRITNLTIDGFGNDQLDEEDAFRDGINYSTRGGDYNVFDNIEVLNIDRRGISVFPETTVGTQITNSLVNNIIGRYSGLQGGLAINLNGTGVVSNNTITNMQTGIIGNSKVSGDVLISGNNLSNFKVLQFNVATGISLYPEKKATITVEDNNIVSTSRNQVGIYSNDKLGLGSTISNNTINLSGEYSVGLDVLNANDPTHSFEISYNDITVGKYSTGISLANVSSSDAARLDLIGNIIRNTGDDDDFDNDYRFNYFFDRDINYGREVGILVSASQETKRVINSDTGFTYLNVLNNTVEGFKESLVYVRDSFDTGSVADLNLSGNRFDGFESDFVSKVATKVEKVVTFSDLTFDLQPLRNVTLYKTNLSFISNGGTAVSTINKYSSDSLSLVTPTRTGYTFTGWYTNSALSNRFTSNQMPSVDTVLHAGWTINTYNVDFVDHNGNLIKRETVSYGESATAPSSPLRVGYSFVGWSTDFSSITSDVWVQARYNQIILPTPVTPTIPVPPVIETPTAPVTPNVPTPIEVVGNRITKFEVVGLEESVLLTDDEKANDVKVVLEVKELSLSSVPQADQGVMNSYFKEKYGDLSPRSLVLDMSLLKVGNNDSTNVTNTDKPISISFALPSDLHNIDFEIIRIHDGVLEVLPHTVNKETNEVTFETDRFSTYAVVEKVQLTPIETPTEDTPKSSSMLFVLIPVIILFGVGIYLVTKRTRKS